MRILLCVNRDLMANLALNLLWPALQGHSFDLVLSDGVAKAAPKAPEIVSWGRAETALMDDVLFPQLDRQSGSAGFRSFAGMAAATESGTLHSFRSLNRDDGLAFVQGFHPDVVVSIRFGQIFKAPVIAVPRHGILNLHSGILPRYRGVLATFWALLRGDDEIGCTLHAVTDGTIDTGPVLGIHRLPADRERSVMGNVASLYAGGTAMIAAALNTIARGETIETVRQDAGESGYYSYPLEADVAAFQATGGHLSTHRDYQALFDRYGLMLDAATARLTGTA